MEETINAQEPESVEELGGEATQGLDDVNSSDSSNEPPKMIPYSRFSEKVAKDNEIISQLQQRNQEMQTQMMTFVNNIQSQQGVNDQGAKMPDFETVDQVVKYLEEDVLPKRIEERLKPLEQKAKMTSYQNTIQSYFSQNPDAAKIRGKIDGYFDSLPQNRRTQIAEAISMGDTSVLNEIYYTVNAMHAKSLNQAANVQVTAEVQQAQQPQAYRTARYAAPTTTDLINKGKKEGNFQGFFQSFAQKQFGQ